MEELRDLQQIFSSAIDRFGKYKGEDFMLPMAFKEQVKEVNSNTITYNKYSAIAKTKGNQNGVLNIYLPNQWFYIASYFTDFYNELQRYKREALKVASKERLKELNGARLNDTEIGRLNGLSLDETSRGHLVRFMTDYSWWSGAKTIDRGDFYVSPILTGARLVNASQSFVAELCAFLADKQELVRAIISGAEETVDGSTNIQMFLSHQPPLLLSAIRTKPFILLAGISGTGKSRIVREFAFKSCPKFLQDEAGTTPGNYCMIEVKPNWHDSTELLGYYSRLGNSPGYQFTKFVKFLVKAKMYPSVPFFVCLDEMNLAPVEQYFAEILSILETRKSVSLANGERTIKTGAIIDAEHFRDLGKIGGYSRNFTDRDIFLKLHNIATENDISEEVGSRADLTTEGLTLPDNVIIVGTVNMDDTTHQFSRKVIDRAMTIEMNGGNLRNMFGGSRNLEYLPQEQQEKWQNAFSRQYVTADEVLAAHSDVADTLMDELPSRLEEINKALKGTPFEVSYRVLNELTIMVGVLLDEGKVLNDAIAHSVNNILLMKILPRIEGDSEMFALAREYKSKAGVHYDNRLEWLKEIAPDINEALTDSEIKAHQPTAKEKIQEMIDRLNNQEFTRFWP